MWISKQPRHPDRPAPRGRALDAFGLVVALAFLPEFVGARAGVVLQPHPGWIAVLVLAARYGSGGLFTGLIAGACAVGIGSAVAGSRPRGSWGRLPPGAHLIPVCACPPGSRGPPFHFRRPAGPFARVIPPSRPSAAG